jgi:hypothetical protein
VRRISWSWRRDLNPRPSDYKNKGMGYEGVRLVDKSMTYGPVNVENVARVQAGGSLGGSLGGCTGDGARRTALLPRWLPRLGRLKVNRGLKLDQALFQRVR